MHLRTDPRVSLTVLAENNLYSQASIHGQASELVDDEALRAIDRLAQHYTGKPYPNRTSPRVSTHVTIERIHLWGALRGQ